MCFPGTQICSPGTQHGVLEAGLGVLEAGLGVLKAGKAGLGGLERHLGAFKWSWAIPERSGDVPEGARAQKIEFSLVLGGFEGGGPTAALWRGVFCPTPKASFF